MSSRSTLASTKSARSVTCAATARAYNAAGRNYALYADGDSEDPLDFSSAFSFADREVWSYIDSELVRLHATGQRKLAVLDAGCGPGTWLRRIILRAQAIGFESIEAHGLDLSPAQITFARTESLALRSRNATIVFETGDITRPLPFADRQFDLTLCLYAVLNHVTRTEHLHVASELARVTRNALFVSVRAAGSLPTIYIDKLANARSFHQDNDADWMAVEMQDGNRVGLPSHLFRSSALRLLFEPHFPDVSVVGLDLFHSRFAGNPHWNPPELDRENAFEDCLTELERRYAGEALFIDRATHILLIARQ